MVEYMDKMVGRVTAQLDASGLSEKTLVIFTGDNGTHPSLQSGFQGRLVKGDKGRPTDAGTHVPLIAQWKGHVPAGRVSQDLVDFTDFLPTLGEIAGDHCQVVSRLTDAALRRNCAGRKGSRANGSIVITIHAGPISRSPATRKTSDSNFTMTASSSITAAMRWSRTRCPIPG